jgi:hypothetical protein
LQQANRKKKNTATQIEAKPKNPTVVQDVELVDYEAPEQITPISRANKTKPK